MNAAVELEWSAANQQVLAAELTRLRALLGDGDLADAVAALESLRASISAPVAIDTLAQRFELSPFERDVLLLAASVELDARFAGLCAAASGAQRPFPTFSLALAALPDAHWSALAPVEPLRARRLIELDDSAGLTSGRLRIDERVLHFLCGLQYVDPRLRSLLKRPSPAPLMADVHRAAAEQTVALLRARPGKPPVIALCGDDRDGQNDVAVAIAEALALVLFELDAADVPAAPHEQVALAALWQREAALLGASLLITQSDDGARAAQLARFIAELHGLVFIGGRTIPALDGAVLRLTIDRPQAPGQRRLWQAAVGARAPALASTAEGASALDVLAGQHRLSARRIASASAQIDPRVGTDAQVVALRKLVQEDARAMSELAQAIEPRAGWDDLVLPAPQLQALRQVAVHARHRITVHHDWGFAGKGERGLGIATLFWGDSGTGKTLAAEVLAGSLGLPLYRVDLSATVSKYIGETEKNLRKIFDTAEEAGALLLFDEADALFGKRSDVKDSHDRYANIEVSYLLQRMEAYRGLAILTTNHRAALDTAFQRRLRFVVHFPFPDVAQREAIWRASFPSGAPLGDIDYGKLARLNVAGGAIRNIALSAAFLAAEARTPLTMAMLLRAAQLESAKGDKPPSESETRGWV